MPDQARLRRTILASTLLLAVFLLSTGGWLLFRSLKSAGPERPVTLAEFTESGVKVVIRLELDAQGKDILAVTFTAVASGFHVYSKDVPREGIDGLGRPTLLELPPGAKMQATGSLQESVAPLVEPIQKDLPDLHAYPEGPVSLYLPVQLPQTAGEITDAVSVTYMACSQKGCKKPVEGKIIPVSYRTKAP